MSPDALDVSIIIPNYQGEKILPATLQALREALATSSLRTEVVVVDDASRDGSPDYVAREHPDVRLIRQPSNRGFGPTCNRGAAEAGAPLLYFLNSDVSVHEGFLAPLIPRLRDEDCFAAASLNLDEDGRVRSPGQVSPEMRRGQIRLRSLDLDALWRSRRLERMGPIYTLFGSGGSLLVRRDRFLGLGGFADTFAPFYYEDSDLGWRAWRRGWSSAIEPKSLVTHRGGGAIGSTQRLRFTGMVRKRNRFLLVWRNLVDPVAFRREHLLRLPAHLLGSLLRGDPNVICGFAAALRRRRGIAEFRERERSEAKLSDDETFARLQETRNRLLSAAR